MSFDIGIIKLSTELKFGPGVNAVALPSPTETVKAGDNATVTGWGTTSDGADLLPKQLQVVYLPIFDYAKCKIIFPRLDDTMVCAGLEEGGKDSCQVRITY